jgi:hypothetical protein
MNIRDRVQGVCNAADRPNIHVPFGLGRKLTSFQELHYHLALDYLRHGQRDKAAKQIAVLDWLTQDDPDVAFINK